MKAQYQERLDVYLRVFLKLDGMLAAFLAENLQYLNGTSVELLEDLGSSSLMALRCSTVCMINNSEEMKFFKRLVSGLLYTEAARVKVLEDAIRKTLLEGHPVSLKHLKACIGLIQKADLAIKAKR